MGASIVPVPGKPGKVYVPSTGTVSEQTQQYEGSYFDTVEFNSFAVGQKEEPFRNPNLKELQHTNLTKERRLPSDARLKLQRVAVDVRRLAGTSRPSPEDVNVVYELANFSFKLGKTFTVSEGPVSFFPGGRGLAGLSTEPGFSVLSNGVPAMTGAPILREQPDITDGMDLNSKITFDEQTWLTVDDGQPAMVGNVGGSALILVTVELFGIITTPLGS